MEEILASIRRIISEEGGAERDSKAEPAEPAEAIEGDDDILDLTEVIAGGGEAESASEPEAASLEAADEAEADIEAESEIELSDVLMAEPEPADAEAAAEPEMEDEAPAETADAPRFVVEPDTGPELESADDGEPEIAVEAIAEAEAPVAPEPVAAAEPQPEPEPEPEFEPEPEPIVSMETVAAASVAPDVMPDDGAPTAEESIDVPPIPAPEPEPAPAPLAAAPAAATSMDHMIQKAAESAVVASGALATAVATSSALSSHTGETSLGFGVTEEHIETAVREVLKPRLRDWLDKNLAGLVERLVREEIQRLVEQSERSN